MTLVIIFALGYMIGGVSALLLIGLARAGNDRERTLRGRAIHHDA